MSIFTRTETHVRIEWATTREVELRTISVEALTDAYARKSFEEIRDEYFPYIDPAEWHVRDIKKWVA